MSDDEIKWYTTLGGFNAKCEGHRLAIVLRSLGAKDALVSLQIRKHDGGLIYSANHTAPTEQLAVDKAKADAQRMLRLKGVL
jgi:hypothetical protein